MQVGASAAGGARLAARPSSLGGPRRSVRGTLVVTDESGPEGSPRGARAQNSRTVFMMVPALVATTPPSIAPAIIFGDCNPPPLHFSQANLPPA